MRSTSASKNSEYKDCVYNCTKPQPHLLCTGYSKANQQERSIHIWIFKKTGEAMVYCHKTLKHRHKLQQHAQQGHGSATHWQHGVSFSTLASVQLHQQKHI